MADPKVKDPFLECLSEQLALGNPLPPRILRRIVHAKAPVNTERAEERVIPESKACRDRNLPDPEIADLLPDVSEVEKLHDPDLVEESIVQTLEQIRSQFHASLDGEVPAEQRELRIDAGDQIS